MSKQMLLSDAEEQLKAIVNIQGEAFEKKLKQSEALTTAMETYVKSTIELDKIKDSEYMDSYNNLAADFVYNTIEGYDGKSGWVIYDSNTAIGTALSVSENANGVLERGASYDARKEGYDKDSWWADAYKNGDVWTDPYYWEAWDVDIMSYSKLLSINGINIGVTGTELFFGDLQKEISEIVIYDTGYLALYNANLDIIIHPVYGMQEDGTTYNLAKVDEGHLSNLASTIKTSTEDVDLLYYEWRGQDKMMSYKRLSNGWYIAAHPKQSEVLAELNRLTMMIISISLAVILLAAIASFILGRKISKNILIAIGSINELSTGELTTSMDVESSDEIGDMSGAFNLLMDKLRDVIYDMKNVSADINERNIAVSKLLDLVIHGKNSSFTDGSLDNGMSQVQELMQGIMDNVRNQAANTEETLAGLEEILASAENISSSTKEVLGISRDSDAAANNAANKVSDLSENLQIVSNSVDETNTKVDSLTELSSKINLIVTSIKGISDQINLLALNASIEAARAGEAGKGFAVVADEVRKLAEEANKETEKISTFVSDIQLEVAQVKESNDKVTEGVSTSTKLMDEVNTNVKEVSAFNSDINQLIETVSELAEQQNLSITDITHAVTDIAENSVDIEGSSNVSHEATLLVSEKLSDVVESFKAIVDQAEALRKKTEFFK